MVLAVEIVFPWQNKRGFGLITSLQIKTMEIRIWNDFQTLLLMIYNLREEALLTDYLNKFDSQFTIQLFQLILSKKSKQRDSEAV